MRKNLTLVLSLFIFLCFPLFSQTELQQNPREFTPLVFDEIRGAYAIYRDTSSGETSYIGLCALGGNQLALRLFVPSTKTELLVLHTFYTVTNLQDSAMLNSAMLNSTVLNIEPGTIDLIRGDFAAADSTKRFLPVIYSALNAWLHSRVRFDDSPEYTFAEDALYTFQYWVPVLQMKAVDVRQTGPDSAGLTLITSGVVESGNDPVFFAYKGESAIVDGPDVAITAAAEQMAAFPDISVPLDSNWNKGRDGVYRISQATAQDAYCMVETFNMEDFPGNDTFDLIKFFILYSGSTLLCEGLRIFAVNENPCLFYRVYDAQTQRVTVHYKLFVPKDQKSISVVSLGAFESVYNANKDFFDAIFF